MVDQPSQKSYKIRGHSRQRKSSKPYSRPNEPKNKGLLDTVKGYLSPSWLFGYFTSSEDEQMPTNYEEDVFEENATVTHEEGSTSSAYTANQDRLASVTEENDDPFSSDRTVVDATTDRSDPQAFERAENANLSIRLSGTLNDDEEDENEQRALEQQERPYHSVSSISTEQLKRKPLPSLLHSRLASTSLLLQRGAARSQRNALLGASQTNLYTPSVKFSTPMPSNDANPSSTKSSVSLTRPSSLTFRNSSVKGNSFTKDESLLMIEPEPSVLTTGSTTTSKTPGKPLFSVEKFVTPVQRRFTNKRVGSPSYPGPVMFGGALNVSRDVSFKRRKTSTSPGSESYHHPVSKLRIRGVKENTIQNSTLGGTGTRTAQRILDALQSVSSPLKDVRRIPSPISLASASPLSFKPSKMRTSPPKTKVGPRVSYLQAKLLGDSPPVSSLQTAEVARVSFIEDAASNEARPRSPSPPPSKAPSHTVDDQSFFSGLKDTVLKSSLPASFAPKSLPTSLSPIQSTSKSSGKMKTVPRSTAMHYSSGKNQVDEAINPLPEIRNAVPLPINLGRNMSLPMFSNNKVAKEAEIATKTEESLAKNKISTESPKNGFMFSTPVVKCQRFSVKEALEVADNEVSFSFSEPLPVKKDSDKTKLNSRSPLVQAQQTTNISRPTTISSSNQTAKSTPPFSNGPSTNDFFSEKSPAEDFGKSEPAQTSSFAKQFAPAADSWGCAGEMPETKPVSQDKQEIDLTEKFVPPKDPWEHPTTTIENKATDLKSVARETSKPGAIVNEDLRIKFAAPSGSWECATCMLQNKATDLKCIACETAKPGAESTTGSSQAAFSVNTTSSSGSGFAFGAGSSAGSGFTFVASNPKPASDAPFTFVQKTTVSNKAEITFGQKSVTTTSSVSAASNTSGFTFGTSATNKANPSFTFGVEASQDDSKAAPFSFGAGSQESSKNGSQESSNNGSLSKDDENEKVIDKPATMNIAEAAAAGLLKVPSVLQQPAAQPPAQPPASQTSLASAEPSTMAPFTFEATSSLSSNVQQVTLPNTVTKPFALQESKTSTASTKTASGGLFTFGAAQQPLATVSSLSSNNPAPMISFNSSTPLVNTTASSAHTTTPFSFNAISSSSTSTAGTTTPLFNFTGSATTKTSLTSTTTNSTPIFPFTGSSQAVKNKPSVSVPLFNFAGAANGPISSNVTSVASTPAAGLFSFTGTQQSNTTAPIVENNNSLGGEEMDADSNSNHDQTTFPQAAAGGFTFSTPAPASTSGIFSAGSTAAPGSTSGGFNFNPSAGITPSFQFGNPSTSSGGFNFGAASTAGSTPFMFGGASTPASGNANPSATQTPFNFGGSAAPTQVPNQPALFNIGALTTHRVFKKAVRRNRR